MTVNANSCEGNFFHSDKSISLWMADDYLVGIEEVIKRDPKTFCGYVDLKKKRVGYPSVMLSNVVWHVVLMTSAIFLLILYNEHMLMMFGCLLIPNQISCKIIHLSVLFSSL
jgi:hypothetical protein